VRVNTPASNGGDGLTVYQLRLFDPDGAFSHSRSLEAENDTKALQCVMDLPDRYQMELWRADELVWRSPPKG
jgi:hypothetical protein